MQPKKCNATETGASGAPLYPKPAPTFGNRDAAENAKEVDNVPNVPQILVALSDLKRRVPYLRLRNWRVTPQVTIYYLLLPVADFVYYFAKFCRCFLIN